MGPSPDGSSRWRCESRWKAGTDAWKTATRRRTSTNSGTGWQHGDWIGLNNKVRAHSVLGRRTPSEVLQATGTAETGRARDSRQGLEGGAWRPRRERSGRVQESGLDLPPSPASMRKIDEEGDPWRTPQKCRSVVRQSETTPAGRPRPAPLCKPRGRLLPFPPELDTSTAVSAPFSATSPETLRKILDKYPGKSALAAPCRRP